MVKHTELAAYNRGFNAGQRSKRGKYALNDLLSRNKHAKKLVDNMKKESFQEGINQAKEQIKEIIKEFPEQTTQIQLKVKIIRRINNEL